MSVYRKVSVLFIFLTISVMVNGQQKNDGQFLFKQIKTRLTIAEKNHLFEQLSIKWSKSKKQFVDSDDEAEAAPYTKVDFFPVDINKDGVEEVFIILTNPTLFEKVGAEIIFFAKDSDGSYQKNTEFPAEDMVPLSRKHLGYPDMLLSGDGPLFIIWRWNGKIYKFFQKTGGQQLPDSPNKGLEETSKTYRDNLKK